MSHQGGGRGGKRRGGNRSRNYHRRDGEAFQSYTTYPNEPLSSAQDGAEGEDAGSKLNVDAPEFVPGSAIPASDATSAPADIDYTVKHPLQYEWVVWFDKRQAATQRSFTKEMMEYENNLIKIGSFATVEDFWSIYLNLVKPANLPNNANLHFFKSGIKPMWEDKGNAKGGKWIYHSRGNEDESWENLMLALIGENFKSSEQICGAVFSKRKNGDRMALWTANRDDREAIVNLGTDFRRVLNMSLDSHIDYQVHEDSLVTSQSYSNPAWYRM